MPEGTPGAAAGSRGAWDVALRACLWLLLGGWVGTWLFFGAVVSRVAFRVLPSTEVAGALIGPVLGSLHLFGGLAGVALAALTLALGRGVRLAVIPLVMGAVCVFSHVVVTTQIEALRDLAFGPGGSEQVALRFQRLHQLSVGLFLAVGAAGIVLAGLHARVDSREAARGASPAAG